jgi:hypothetical protein
VTRVLYADGIIKTMNVGNNGYYLANKASIGKLFFDNSKFTQSNTPQVGDVAFWEGHVGIVSEIGKSGTFKLTHAANSKSDILENPYCINSSQYCSGVFYGFFRPETETPDGKQIDVTKDNNVLKNSEDNIVGQYTNTKGNKIFAGRERETIVVKIPKSNPTQNNSNPTEIIDNQ